MLPLVPSAPSKARFGMNDGLHISWNGNNCISSPSLQRKVSQWHTLRNENFIEHLLCARQWARYMDDPAACVSFYILFSTLALMDSRPLIGLLASVLKDLTASGSWDLNVKTPEQRERANNRRTLNTFTLRQDREVTRMSSPNLHIWEGTS